MRKPAKARSAGQGTIRGKGGDTAAKSTKGMAEQPSSRRSARAVARGIKLLILDVDGVLTDGSIILDNGGNELKAFHVRDGHGIKMLNRAGVAIAIITGRESEVVERRARELGIRDVFQGRRSKLAAFETLLGRYGIRPDEVAYVGDDIIDAPVMARVGLPVAVGDADDATKKFAVLVTKQPGGRGAVREVTDFILKAKGLWQGMFDAYFEA